VPISTNKQYATDLQAGLGVSAGEILFTIVLPAAAASGGGASLSDISDER